MQADLSARGHHHHAANIKHPNLVVILEFTFYRV